MNIVRVTPHYIMDDEQRQKHAPRRNKRYAHLRNFNEEAEWADALDWKTNTYDFYRLFQSLFERLDSAYRERCGLRVDQLATREDLFAFARSTTGWYQENEQRFQGLSIYVYLYCTLDQALYSRAHETLERRQSSAADLGVQEYAA